MNPNPAESPPGHGPTPTVLVPRRAWFRVRAPLLPAFAITALAGGLMIARVQTSDWGGLWPRDPLPKVSVNQSNAKSRASEPVSSQALPPLITVQPPVLVAPPTQIPAAPKGSVEVRAPAPIASRPEKVDLAPIKDPEAVAAVAWLDIQREAEEKRAERAELTQLKPILRDAAEAQAAQHALEVRIEFHEKIRACLAEGKRGAILLEHVTPDHAGMGALVPFSQDLTLARSRSRRQAWIHKLRELEIAEPEILAALTDTLLLERTRRGAPRDRESALLRAAEELLKLPPGVPGTPPGEFDEPASDRDDQPISEPKPHQPPSTLRSRRRS